MISLFITNSDTSNVSKNGSQIQLSLNPPIIIYSNKKWYACVTECDIVYLFYFYSSLIYPLKLEGIVDTLFKVIIF